MQEGPSAAEPQPPQPLLSEATAPTSNEPQRLPDQPDIPHCIKVSKESRVGAVAGKIAHTIRDGNCPTMLATGQACIASAAKAIATARNYLTGDARDIVFTPAFRDEHHKRALLSFYITPIDPAESAARLEAATPRELKVSAGSRHAAVAAAVSARLTEHGSAVLSAVGNDAIFNAAMACAHASCYLSSSGRQLQVQPASVRINNGNDTVVAFKMILCLV